MATDLRLEAVVAHWNEDLDWIEKLPCPARVYTKDVHLPNKGREASTFVHHMMTSEPAEYTAFLQGNALDHCKELFTVLRSFEGNVSPLANFVECDRYGAPHHWEQLDLDAAYKYVLGTDECPIRYRFSPGAQYVVHRSVWPDAEMLKRMFLLSMAEKGPWEMERLWWYIWSR